MPPLLVGADLGEEELSDGGPVLGVFEKAAYGAREATLEPGQTLVLLTDGVSEARRPDGEELGAGRLGAIVREGSSRGAAAVAGEIVKLVRGFTGATGFEDDFTLVLLARRAGG